MSADLRINPTAAISRKSLYENTRFSKSIMALVSEIKIFTYTI